MKPGRPREGEDLLDRGLTAMVSESELAAVRAAAQAESRSVASWLRLLIRRELGQLPPGMQTEVNDNLRELFGL